jgi:hypothetical protein
MECVQYIRSELLIMYLNDRPLRLSYCEEDSSDRGKRAQDLTMNNQIYCTKIKQSILDNNLNSYFP